jgi:hypothetical protein
MLELCSKSARNLLEICSKSARNLLEICSKSARHMLEIWSVRGMLEIVSFGSGTLEVMRVSWSVQKGRNALVKFVIDGTCFYQYSVGKAFKSAEQAWMAGQILAKECSPQLSCTRVPVV